MIYKEYEYYSGDYHLYKLRSDNGCSDTVISNSKETVSDAVVKRIHFAKVCLSSNSLSPEVDSFTINVKKPAAP